MGTIQSILNVKHVDITAPYSNLCGKKGLCMLISMNYILYVDKQQ